MEQTLGKRIMCHRKQMHLTQDQLAEKLGVTAQAVSKWENDQSCPDINMLPKLAALFNTTTDALLGHEPIYEAEVVADEQEGKVGREFQPDSGRRNAIGFASLILLIGGLLLTAKLLNLDVGFWGIAWSSALLVFGVVGLIQRFRFTRIACTLLGGYFLVNNLNIVQIDLRSDLIIPILILIFGVCLLVDGLKKPKKSKFHIKKHGENGKTTQNFTQEGESFECSLNFGEANRLVSLPRLSEGNASCSFGELTVDLTGCQEIADGCNINISCSFGELHLLVPKAYRVQYESGTSFGAIETEGEPDSDPKGIIHLTGGVSFGGVEINYV